MTLETQGSSVEDHELLTAFERDGFRLNDVLYEMLNEDHRHRTERRGAGFTQATRHLAEHVNSPRHPYEYDEARLFADRDSTHVRSLVLGAAALGIRLSWRNLDRQEVQSVVEETPALARLHRQEVERQRRLRSVTAGVTREESRVLARMIINLLLPANAAQEHLTELPPCHDQLSIGTCPLAEKYFLELADRYVRRKGLMNVIVATDGSPLCIEKLHLGDNHSCISLTSLVLNGVHLPPGSLLGVKYATPVAARANRELPGDVIPVQRCEGFRFLRLTTLAISPENRRRAFTNHFEAQVQGGLFAPGRVTIEEIEHLARQQL
ncbi:MAG TPA: hypothetical protein VJT73_19355 [Polyangiaceae bacterium]|nr:hypothetical protein [Polyangiaceae bacterium]